MLPPLPVHNSNNNNSNNSSTLLKLPLLALLRKETTQPNNSKDNNSSNHPPRDAEAGAELHDNNRSRNRSNGLVLMSPRPLPSQLKPPASLRISYPLPLLLQPPQTYLG